MKELIPVERIERKIYLFRGQKVMLDRDLAVLYGVKPIRLREQVKRNIERFPSDFVFKLNENEIELLVSQNAIPSIKHLGGHRPFAFTDYGILMLSSVLRSRQAVQVNIQIMRAFIKLKQIIFNNKELAQKLDELEKQVKSNTTEIRVVFDAIRLLLTRPEKKVSKIGFLRSSENGINKLRKR